MAENRTSPELLKACLLSGQMSAEQHEAHIEAGEMEPIADTPSQTLRKAASRVADEIDNLRRVFGAPGDHGYNTPEGQALYSLYMAWAKLRQALKVGAPADAVTAEKMGAA